jgi:DNA-binding NtrC family response regulator
MQTRQPGVAGQIQRLSKWIVRAARAGAGGYKSVLVISKERYEPIGSLCRRLRWELNYATDLPIALVNLQDQRFDVVIYDRDLSDQDWRPAVTSLAATAPWSSILLLSPLGHPELWNEVIRRGGHDILGKPISEDAVESALGLAMARAKLRCSLEKRKTGKRNTAVV